MPTDAPDGNVNAYVVRAAPKARKAKVEDAPVESAAPEVLAEPVVESKPEPVKKAAAKKTSTK